MSDLLVHFCEVTGADSSLAKQYLELNSWNVEEAIACYLEDPNGSNYMENNKINSKEQIKENNHDYVRAPIKFDDSMLLGTQTRIRNEVFFILFR